jgi:hypothetical protein
MGSTEQYLIVPEQASESRRKAAEAGASESLGNGWAVLHWLLPEVSVGSLEGRVDSAVRDEAAPALGGFLEDSDYVFLCWAAPDLGSHKAIVASENALDYEEGKIGLSGVVESPTELAIKLSAWSRATPKRISPKRATQVLKHLESDLESLLPSLLEALGVVLPQWPPPAFAEAVGIDDSREGREFRYVYGYGTDFAGVWDRNTPGPPIRRYPKTREGAEAAWKEAVVLSASDKAP